MKKFSDGIILAAHRGERTVVPENTLAAFRYALSQDIDAVETDFHLSKDGRLVVIHDHTLERTTNGQGRVCDYTLEELRKLSAGGWFDGQFEGEKIPTAEEFFSLVADKDVLLNLEFKVYPHDEGEERAVGAVEKIIAMAKEFGIKDERIMLNSWSIKLLAYVRKKYGKQYVLHGYYPLQHFKDSCEGNPFSYMDFACLFPVRKQIGRVCPKEDYDALHSHGVLSCNFMPAVYTDYQKAIEYGTRMFTVDDIKTSECILRSLGVR